MGVGVMADARPLEIQQLQAYLTQEFNGLITGTGKDEEAIQRNFLSKALAAYFLMRKAGATKADAVAASIDGGNDHGIDSVYIAPTGVIWLVQSKYIHEGKGEPILGDASKFKDGVIDFVRARFERFNDALQAKLSVIQHAMAGNYQVRFALAYTGTSLNDDRIQLFNDVEAAFNDIQQDRARFVRFGLLDFHDELTARRAERTIDVEIELRNFGLIERPARAFYGTMRVRDLAALYQEHDHALVRANIRRYRGSSRVNDEITKTLRNQAEHFVYFNNGVTLLCNQLTPVGATDPNRRTGRFRLTGVSIINGAQTAGTVAREPLAHYDANPADVLVTCIQATPDMDGFGDQVTEYRNSQNAVQLQDFIALDDNQENWRKTLRASGVNYIYKQSASDPHTTGRVFTAQEAANHLAAAYADRNHWTHSLLMLGAAPQNLWDQRTDFTGAPVEDPDASVYRKLFPDSLTARKLWRTTQMGRLIQRPILDDASTLPPDEAALAIASANLVAHIVFVRQGGLRDGVTLMLTQAEQQAVSAEADRVRAALHNAYRAHEGDWLGAEPAAVFADAGHLRMLKGAVMQALQQP
jgi:AIPR protein